MIAKYSLPPTIVPTSAANVTSFMISSSSPRWRKTVCATMCAMPNAAIIASPKPVSFNGPSANMNGSCTIGVASIRIWVVG